MKLVNKKDVKIVVIDGNYLEGLIQSNTNKAELRIIYNIMQQIDCNKIEKQSFVFEHGKVEDIFNDAHISKENMLKKLARLKKFISLYSSKSRDEFGIIQVFSDMEFSVGKDGFWMLKISCTKAAVESIFSAEYIDFLRFNVRCILDLNSSHSVLLFLLLQEMKKEYSSCGESTIKVKINIDELKSRLKADSVSYNQFREFNQKVLKKCHTEINKKTVLHFDYEPVDRDNNRRYTAIEFTIYNADEEFGLSDDNSSDDSLSNQVSKVIPTKSSDIWNGMSLGSDAKLAY